MPDIVSLFCFCTYIYPLDVALWQSFFVYNLESKTYKILTFSATTPSPYYALKQINIMESEGERLSFRPDFCVGF